MRGKVLLVVALSLLFVGCGEKDESPFAYPLSKAAGLLQHNEKGSNPGPAAETTVSPEEEEFDTLFGEEVELPFVTEHFYYEGKGRRDPFRPLVTQKSTESPGLNINNITLVGTMWGPGGMLALLKEKGGTGHVLKQGDKVAGGRVVRITQDSITFQMDQFGVTTEVTFHLKEKE